jgi:thiamine-phosphate pyrophosphorylase
MTLSVPIICLVTDRRALTPDARTTRDETTGLERQLDDAMAVGVDLVQLRERDLPGATLRALAAGIVRRAGQATRVVVNDRVDVALAVGAAGAHLRADGPRVAVVRELGPAGWMVGRSVHSTAEAGHASDADYLVFGTVFASASKRPDAPVVGQAALRQAVAAARVPMLAIGGITPARVAACRAAGAAGVAAIGLFLPRGRRPDALGPSAAVLALRHAWLDRTGS